MQKTLREICKEYGITLTELGRRIGKSKQYMSELGKQRIRLRYDMAVKIAAALGTTPDQLFLPEESRNIRTTETASAKTDRKEADA